VKRHHVVVQHAHVNLVHGSLCFVLCALLIRGTIRRAAYGFGVFPFFCGGCVRWRPSYVYGNFEDSRISIRAQRADSRAESLAVPHKKILRPRNSTRKPTAKFAAPTNACAKTGPTTRPNTPTPYSLAFLFPVPVSLPSRTNFPPKIPPPVRDKCPAADSNLMGTTSDRPGRSAAVYCWNAAGGHR